MGDMLACCGVQEHPWDRHNVKTDWLPASIRCLIVGENPGAARSEYFYNPPTSYARDRVVVRKGLLHGLHAVGLLNAATLEGFRDAGFLLDRKSTRLNSSHDQISYAVFCLKKKTKTSRHLGVVSFS